jgi:hypothetical protein
MYSKRKTDSRITKIVNIVDTQHLNPNSMLKGAIHKRTINSSTTFMLLISS